MVSPRTPFLTTPPGPPKGRASAATATEGTGRTVADAEHPAAQTETGALGCCQRAHERHRAGLIEMRRAAITEAVCKAPPDRRVNLVVIEPGRRYPRDL